jgi:hypothetical protein
MLRRIHTTDEQPVAESGYVAEGRTVEATTTTEWCSATPY